MATTFGAAPRAHKRSTRTPRRGGGRTRQRYDSPLQCKHSLTRLVPPAQRFGLTSSIRLDNLGRLRLDLDDLAEHDGGVAVQERDAGQALAVLERVHHQRLLGLELHLRHLVRLERVGALQLLAAGLLAVLLKTWRELSQFDEITSHLN